MDGIAPIDVFPMAKTEGRVYPADNCCANLIKANMGPCSEPVTCLYRHIEFELSEQLSLLLSVIVSHWETTGRRDTWDCDKERAKQSRHVRVPVPLK